MARVNDLLSTYLANVNSRSRSLYVVDRPSVCLSSVTFVRPIQPVDIFGNVSTPFGIGHPLTSKENFTEIAPGEPLCFHIHRAFFPSTRKPHWHSPEL